MIRRVKKKKTTQTRVRSHRQTHTRINCITDNNTRNTYVNVVNAHIESVSISSDLHPV